MTNHNTTEMTEEDRQNVFNRGTNKILAEIDEYLVNNSAEPYNPNYVSLNEKPALSTVKKWQHEIDSLDKNHNDDFAVADVYYKLYLCQALVLFIEGNDTKSRTYFTQAMKYARYDVVLYYLDIAKSVGAKVPKKIGNNKPQNSYQLNAAITKPNGKVPLLKYLTVVLPYAVSSHFSEWTDEEQYRFVFLRAIEWLALPAFVLIGVGAPLLFIMNPVWLIIITVVANLVWSLLIATNYVSLGLSELCVYLNKLKFITVPFTSLIFFVRHDYKLMAFALIWPILGIILSLIRGFDSKGTINIKLKQQIFLKTR